MATVSVRYIVDDVDASIAFYCGHLEFHEVMRPAPTFAMLVRGDLRLLLSAPGGPGGGGQAMPDGTQPTPGGWNRFTLEVGDLESLVATLRDAGSALSQRHRRRDGREADSARRSVGKPDRAVRTHTPRGRARQILKRNPEVGRRHSPWRVR